MAKNIFIFFIFGPTRGPSKIFCSRLLVFLQKISTKKKFGQKLYSEKRRVPAYPVRAQPSQAAAAGNSREGHMGFDKTYLQDYYIRIF